MDRILKYSKLSIVIAVCIQAINMLLNVGNSTTFSIELENFGQQLIFASAITFAISYYNDYISKIYSWQKEPKKRLWVGVIGIVIVAMLTIAIVRVTLALGIYNKSFEDFIASEKREYYVISLLITIVITAIAHAYYFFKELQNQKITEQKIIAGTASAKFTALKNQLDPHFLFNSLNVLTSLIEENPRMAQKFTTSLSKVYRYVLEQKDKDLVTVDEELKFARTYMTLIKLRFEDSIIFDIPESATNPDAKVVPLSLQILLENTIKHNVVTPAKPLHIKIYEKEGFLYVENNLQPKEILQQSSGVGLGNVQQRYALLTKRKFSVYKTDNAFIAELPVLTKQIGMLKVKAIENEEAMNVLKYKRAKDQVKQIKKFYINLIAYCCVIPYLAFKNYQENDFEFVWVIFPALGWGLGLLFNAMKAFNYHPILGKNWEQKKIKKYMESSKK